MFFSCYGFMTIFTKGYAVVDIEYQEIVFMISYRLDMLRLELSAVDITHLASIIIARKHRPAPVCICLPSAQTYHGCGDPAFPSIINHN